MSPDRFVPSTPRRPARQRFLVTLAALLCALCALCAAGSAGGHSGVRTAPPATVSTESGPSGPSGPEFPHDIQDTARPPGRRQGHRPLAPPRPAHRRPATGQSRPRARSLPALHHASSPRAQRCMVLRC